MQSPLPIFLKRQRDIAESFVARPLMLDLFCGRGGASVAFRELGWDVVGVDANPSLAPDVVADVRSWSWRGRRPELVWASVPCAEFARMSMPWTRARTSGPPSMELYGAARRIISECEPRFWIIENVRGAVPFFGEPVRRIGPVYLWGVLPPHFPDFKVRPYKERISGRKPQSRSITPYAVSLALALYTQHEMAERKATGNASIGAMLPSEPVAGSVPVTEESGVT